MSDGAEQETEQNIGIPTVEGAAPEKSPLLTAHRISVTSDMDDVSLEEGNTCFLLECLFSVIASARYERHSRRSYWNDQLLNKETISAIVYLVNSEASLVCEI